MTQRKRHWHETHDRDDLSAPGPVVYDPFPMTIGEAMAHPRAAALWYAERGVRVHPLKQRDKAPLLDAWPEKASSDVETILGWWKRWPDANVGLVPGPRSAGLAVMDVDPRKGDLVKIDALIALLPEKRVPLTWRVRTGSGGYHLYFDASAVKGPLPAAIGGIELKANDKLNIVAPPSIHPNGTAYVIEQAAPLAPFPPAWLNVPVAPPKPAAKIADTDVIGRVGQLLGRLDVRRADNYESWLQVGMALHAVSDTFLGAWDGWSHQSPKWREGVCAEKWRSFEPKTHGLTLGSLVAWAREDEERGGLICAAEVETERIDWLWYGRLARGKLQGLVGLPDQGKDTTALNVAARLSKGAPMPGTRSATSISVADAAEKAASWSTYRTPRPASTSGSKARTSSSIS